MINRKRSEILSSDNLGYSNPACNIWNIVVYSQNNDLPTEILDFFGNKLHSPKNELITSLENNKHYILGSYIKEIADAIKVQIELLSQKLEYSIRIQIEPT